MYQVDTFTLAIRSRFAWTEKFSNGVCTYFFLQLRGRKSLRNTSRNTKSQLWMDPKDKLGKAEGNHTQVKQ